jgi:uncharacterized protein YcbX
MPISQLWTYPVKSLQGAPSPTVTIGDGGIVGDRAFGLRDVATGIVLTGRRDPLLLHATGAVDADGRVLVVLPDGTRTRDDVVLSAWVGRPVRLVEADDRPGTYEIAVDPEDDDSPVTTWQGPAGSFHDSTRTQVSIVATGDLGGWDVRRFRPNIVVEAATADHLVGATVRTGTAEVEVVKPIDRCVMVTRPQPGGIAKDLDVLRTIHRQRGNRLGVGGLVRRGGTVSVGDRVEVIGRG